MTKAEARAIDEGTARALRGIEGTDMPWSEMTDGLRAKVYLAITAAADEVRRIRAMALAELEGGAK